MTKDIYKRNRYVIYNGELDETGFMPLLVNFKIKQRDLNGDNVTIDISDIDRMLARDLLGCATSDARSGVLAALTDNTSVAEFALRMIDKLAAKRADGYAGWQEAGVEHLATLLYDHLEKGDPVDIANFAMMLGMRDAGGATPESRRQTLATVFEELVASRAVKSPAYQELLKQHKELTRRLGEVEAEKERLATSLRRTEAELSESRKMREKDADRARATVDMAQANLAQTRENLSRALGYIDRVNEDAGRVSGAPQRFGPVIEGSKRWVHVNDGPNADQLYPDRGY